MICNKFTLNNVVSYFLGQGEGTPFLFWSFWTPPSTGTPLSNTPVPPNQGISTEHSVIYIKVCLMKIQ